MSLKFTRDLCIMTMKNDAKFGQELISQFKTGMRNLMIFDSSTHLYFNGLLLTKVYNV